MPSQKSAIAANGFCPPPKYLFTSLNIPLTFDVRLKGYAHRRARDVVDSGTGLGRSLMDPEVPKHSHRVHPPLSHNVDTCLWIQVPIRYISLVQFQEVRPSVSNTEAGSAPPKRENKAAINDQHSGGCGDRAEVGVTSRLVTLALSSLSSASVMAETSSRQMTTVIVKRLIYNYIHTLSLIASNLAISGHD